MYTIAIVKGCHEIDTPLVTWDSLPRPTNFRSRHRITAEKIASLNWTGPGKNAGVGRPQSDYSGTGETRLKWSVAISRENCRG